MFRTASRDQFDGMDEFEYREQHPRKRMRYEVNNTYHREDDYHHDEHSKDSMMRKVMNLERIVEQERHNAAIAERKRRQTLRAFFTLVHDARYHATLMRKWIERQSQMDEQGELEKSSTDIIHEIKARVDKIITLGHCPLSGEPLGEQTYINTCGHIFEKSSLAPKTMELCPECSHKMVYPRYF
jgi:hypothetical protein